MELLARLYVNYVEPSIKVGLFLIIAFMVLQIWSALREGKKLGDILGVAVSSLIKITITTLKIIGKVLSVIFAVLQRTLKEVVKAVSDFFTSKI